VQQRLRTLPGSIMRKLHGRYDAIAMPVPDRPNLSSAPPPYQPNTARPAVRRARSVAVASLLALIALCLAWELWLAPLRPGGSWLALKALPLCIPLAGFLKNRMYTYRWVSLMVWLYFTEGVVRGWSDRPPSNWLALGRSGAVHRAVHRLYGAHPPAPAQTRAAGRACSPAP
jgi:uncharacterized membrane protein